jgi:hypothetical protein
VCTIVQVGNVGLLVAAAVPAPINQQMRQSFYLLILCSVCTIPQVENVGLLVAAAYGKPHLESKVEAAMQGVQVGLFAGAVTWTMC